MKRYLGEAVNALCESIRFDSSLSAPLNGMPFGEGAAKCLAHFLALAENMGLETHNYDNFAGEAIFGDGAEEFAVLCHLDVVPAGAGWTKDPFGGTVEGGKIWGRGATDDKGPAIACLYALKALKDEGFRPKKKIKLILGCNEECGWKCIEHYNKVAHMPEEGFSPDADFPVIYAEKGILHAQLRFPVYNAPFSSFEGGERANMVCDYCTSLPLVRDEEREARLNLQFDGGKLISRGKSAHGSTPEQGVNAILPMLEYYGEHEGVRRAIDCLFSDQYGLKALRDETGSLTLSPDVVQYKDGCLCFLCDIRYPATFSVDKIYALLDKFGVKYETENHQAPLMNEKDGKLVSTLLSVYEEYTGKKAEPIAIGGGTYARALKRGAAFGPELAGDEVTIHQANEYISVERMEMLLEIYKKAIKRLTE